MAFFESEEKKKQIDGAEGERAKTSDESPALITCRSEEGAAFAGRGKEVQPLGLCRVKRWWRSSQEDQVSSRNAELGHSGGERLAPLPVHLTDHSIPDE